MRRFFLTPGQITGDIARLGPEEARHAARVLRLAPGDAAELLDGRGNVFEAVFTELTTAAAELTIIKKRKTAAPSGRLLLAQALLKGKKMDLIVQKATEFGVDTLQPLVTDRSIPADKTGRKKRLDRISIAACKQCGRPRPLHILSETSLDRFLQAQARDENRRRLFFWENEKKQGIREVMATPTPHTAWSILVGPEGGFTDQEAQSIIQAGFAPLGLGPQILRAETAAITAMVLGQFFLGNLDTNQHG